MAANSDFADPAAAHSRPVSRVRRDNKIYPADALHVIVFHDAVADNVDDLSFLLMALPHRDHQGGHDLAPVGLEPIGPKNSVGDANLALGRH